MEASSIPFPLGLLIQQNTSARNVRHTHCSPLCLSGWLSLQMYSPHSFFSSSRSPAVRGFDMHQACLGPMIRGLVIDVWSKCFSLWKLKVAVLTADKVEGGCRNANACQRSQTLLSSMESRGGELRRLAQHRGELQVVYFYTPFNCSLTHSCLLVSNN